MLTWNGGGGGLGEAKLFKSGRIMVWKWVKGGRGDKVRIGLEMCLWCMRFRGVGVVG